MKIRTLGQLQTALDEEIAWRIKEIADMKLAAKNNNRLSEKTIIRAGIAIIYAHWEGFVKAAAQTYINFVDNQGKTYGELKTCFAVLGISKQMTELVQAKKSGIRIAAVDFIRQSGATPSKLQKWRVDTKSNLKSDVFENIALSIGIEVGPYESRFNLMDESLLSRRNKIAHGEYVDLDVDAWRVLADEVISLMRNFKTDIENAASTSAFVR